MRAARLSVVLPGVLVGLVFITPGAAQKAAIIHHSALADSDGELPPNELPPNHAECAYFGPQRERFTRSLMASQNYEALTQATSQVLSAMGPPAGSRTRAFQLAHPPGTIDYFIDQDLQAAGVQPSYRTTDYEFIRRVTLDLTGRIPAADRVVAFAADASPDKRAKLVEELLAKPEWIDKWTMFYGDLYKNNATSVQVTRGTDGRNAFYKWIHDSLAAAKPYNQMASELIAAQGNNNLDLTQGNINWLVGSVVGGGPRQDIMDQQAADTAETFLGMAHVNCVLCHNGRGHLDSLSLWGSSTTRQTAWGFAGFMAHTWPVRVQLPQDPNNPNTRSYYWKLDAYTSDYQLNTTTGNRPPRQPLTSTSAATVAPKYLFGGASPDKGEDYRAALARMITADPQFARAAVNYLWAQFFGRGIVDPPDQFDPARLDPDNPPPAPWTLQPSNPRLLNALAQQFVADKYDLKSVMRAIVNSDAYQLESQYPGAWSATNTPLFARKFVRRLWAEEIHDAIVQAAGVTPSYTVPGFTNPSTVYSVVTPGFGKISYAMQAPDVNGMPDGRAVSAFLDAFLRGNRDDQPRKGEGSLLQALNLMNDNFVESNVVAASSGTGLIAKVMPMSNDQAVDTMWLTVLSRHPTDAEKSMAVAKLSSGTRIQSAQDLLWSLFNKVDFVFNY